MAEMKEKLKEIVETTLIPEVEVYMEELHELLERNEHSEDDLEAIKEMESFLVELQNILAVIEEDSMPESEYERIYNQIMKNVEEHNHD